MNNSARTIFCRHCGAGGAHRHGLDARRRVRYKCPHCKRTFGKRTRTIRSGSKLSDREWKTVVKFFCFRGGVSGRDIARFFGWNEKTGQKINRILRTLTEPLQPKMLPGVSEWDEAVPLSGQWVGGGVSRTVRQCLLRCIANRSEDVLSALVNAYSDASAFVCTDEHGGYMGVVNRFTVCHSTEFVNRSAPFVHTNRIEGVWGHLKPLGKHIYRGFPRSTLPMFLSEFMFRYNIRCYRKRVAVLSALLSRKSHTLLV